jgi:DNA-binding MarR family transcriptional regulator
LLGGDAGFLAGLVGAITATATQAVATAQALQRLLADDKARLAPLGRIAGSATQILDALFAKPVSNIIALQAATSLTPATIGKVLDALENLGIVREVTGQKRNRIFAYSGYLTILSQETP